MLEIATRVFGVHLPESITHEERTLFENVLLYKLYDFLNFYFNNRSNCSVDTINNQEEFMQEGKVIRNLVNDLIINDEYSIQGIANYTGFPEDVVYEIASGINANPTIGVAKKIIELHLVARRDLYLGFLNKMNLLQA